MGRWIVERVGRWAGRQADIDAALEGIGYERLAVAGDRTFCGGIARRAVAAL